MLSYFFLIYCVKLCSTSIVLMLHSSYLNTSYSRDFVYILHWFICHMFTVHICESSHLSCQIASMSTYFINGILIYINYSEI